MHSNFITPPDFVRSVLIVGATDDQLQAVANTIQGGSTPYNIYLYNEKMNDSDWFGAMALKMDAILVSENFSVPVRVSSTKFGLEQLLKEPVDFFKN